MEKRPICESFDDNGVHFVLLHSLCIASINKLLQFIFNCSLKSTHGFSWNAEPIQTNTQRGAHYCIEPVAIEKHSIELFSSMKNYQWYHWEGITWAFIELRPTGSRRLSSPLNQIHSSIEWKANPSLLSLRSCKLCSADFFLRKQTFNSNVTAPLFILQAGIVQLDVSDLY